MYQRKEIRRRVVWRLGWPALLTGAHAVLHFAREEGSGYITVAVSK
jgi:hypothetical protein